MKNLLRTHTFILTLSLLLSAVLSSAQNSTSFDNAVAYAQPASYTTTAAVSEIARYTSINDILANNYFQLAGTTIHPYMMVENASRNYEPVMVDKNTSVSLKFASNKIEYSTNGQTYTFNIVNVEQYLNTSDKCLIRSKIQVECDAVKIGKEKVKMIEVYVDQNNHISFIAVGDSELYLRP